MKTFLIVLILICATFGPAYCQESVDAAAPPASAPPVETVSEAAVPAPAHVAEPEAVQPKAVETVPAPSVTAEKKDAPAPKPAKTESVAATKPSEPAKPKKSSVETTATKASVSIQETSSIAPPSAPQRTDRVAMMAEHKEKPVAAGRAVGGWSKTVFVTLLKLGFVLVLAYVTILALKWLSAKRDAKPRSAGEMRIMETLALPTGGSLHIVNIHGKTLLIASAAGHVSLLSELEAGEEPHEVKDAGGRFAEQLEKYYVAGQSASPAGRIAALLRDCSSHLHRRGRSITRSGRGSGENNES